MQIPYLSNDSLPNAFTVPISNIPSQSQRFQLLRFDYVGVPLVNGDAATLFSAFEAVVGSGVELEVQ